MGMLKLVKLGRLVVLGIPLMAVAVAVLVLAWGHASPRSAHAEGSRMAVNVGGLGVSCDDPSEPAECSVPLGGFFTLSVDVVEAPADGYVGVQSYLDYGSADYNPALSEDGAGPGTCGDGINNAFDVETDDEEAECYEFTLTYEMLSTAEEIVWPDLASAEIAIRDQPSPGVVYHGGLTGLLPPLPVSDYEGSVVEIVMSCSEEEGTAQVELLPLGGPVAGTFGTGFSLPPDGSSQEAAKAGALAISCVGAADEEPTPGEGPEETAEPTAATATPVAPAADGLPPTGTGGVGAIDADGGGSNVGLWAVIGALLAAAAAGLVVFGWRYTRGRRVS